MGTETLLDSFSFSISTVDKVKLNNPLMGTETSLQAHNQM